MRAQSDKHRKEDEALRSRVRRLPSAPGAGGLQSAEIARLLEAGIHRSRTFAAHLRPMLIAMLRHLPYSRHRGLRRTLLAAKARPAPAGQAAPGAIR